MNWTEFLHADSDAIFFYQTDILLYKYNEGAWPYMVLSLEE